MPWRAKSHFTIGWTHGRLRPITTKKPPADGTYEFEFVAMPPSGIAAQVLTPIASHPLLWRPDDRSTVKGIRVLARSNEMMKMIEGERTARGGRDMRVRPPRATRPGGLMPTMWAIGANFVGSDPRRQGMQAPSEAAPIGASSA
jgi:hypothetical protein